jgi:hypothetical protein
MPRWGPGFRNRIPAAFIPRIAAQYPSRRQCAAAHCPMSPQSVNRIIATTRPEPAMRADQRPDGPLISSDRPNRHPGRRVHWATPAINFPDARETEAATPALRSARRKSSRNSGNARRRVPSRPMSTRSSPVRPSAASSRRAASFSRRRARFRATAPPIFLVTVNPIRAGPSSCLGNACRTRPCVAALRPFAATRRKSARRFSRPGETGSEVIWKGRGRDTR